MQRRHFPSVAIFFTLISILAVPDSLRADTPVAISSFSWHGIEALKAGELEARMISSATSWKPWVDNPAFDELLLQEDLDRILALYRANGYYDAEVDYVLEYEKPGRE